MVSHIDQYGLCQKSPKIILKNEKDLGGHKEECALLMNIDNLIDFKNKYLCHKAL